MAKKPSRGGNSTKYNVKKKIDKAIWFKIVGWDQMIHILELIQIQAMKLNEETTQSSPNNSNLPSVCLLKRWRCEKHAFTMMLLFVASQFSRWNCFVTRKFLTSRVSKHMLTKGEHVVSWGWTIRVRYFLWVI